MQVNIIRANNSMLQKVRQAAHCTESKDLDLRDAENTGIISAQLESAPRLYRLGCEIPYYQVCGSCRGLESFAPPEPVDASALMNAHWFLDEIQNFHFQDAPKVRDHFVHYGRRKPSG